MSIFFKILMTLLLLLCGTSFAGLFTPHDHWMQKVLKIVAGSLMGCTLALGIAWLWA